MHQHPCSAHHNFSPPQLQPIPDFSCSTSTPRQSLVLTWCWLWHDFQRDLGQQLQIWDGLFPSSLLPSKDVLLTAPFADNQIMLWFIFPRSTAPGSGTEFSHRQSFPIDFRTGLQQENMLFHRDALNMETFRGSFPEVPLACREGPRGKNHHLTKTGLSHCEAQHTQALSAGWFAWKGVDRRRTGVKDFSPATSTQHQHGCEQLSPASPSSYPTQDVQQKRY